MTRKRNRAGGSLGLVLSAALAAAPLACGMPEPSGETGPSPSGEATVERREAGLITDQGRNNGHSGFIWIAPSVQTTPGGFTTLDQTGGAANLTINIDRYFASDLATEFKLGITGTAITMVTGASNSNFPGATGPFYGANWTPGNTVASGDLYRVSVQVLSNPARVLGFVDVQVVANQAAANAVDRTQFTPLIVGGTLPIVFRLEAKDTDGDSLNDWRDNCVFTKNINQLDGNSDRVGDACQCLGVPNGTPCGTGCKTGETCTNGVCDGGNPKLPGTPCSTGNLCKQGETCSLNGTCGGGSNKTNGSTCATGNPCKQSETCTNGTCGGGSNRAGGTSCRSGNPCKQNETCSSGTCGGGSNRSTGTACSTTGNPCTSGQTCSSGGNCTGTATNKANGTVCGDDRFCTLNDTCQAGRCTGTAVSCVSGACRDPAVCNRIGLCGRRSPDGTPCSDGNACTGPDTCLALVCQGPAVTCTTDTCHTVGSCVPATGCPAPVAKADDTVCNDGNACTLFDACRFGECMAVQTACPATPVRIRSRSNTLIRQPYGSEFADIDGDGIAEIVTATANRLFANRTQLAGGGIGHHYFDQYVVQLLVGHFSGAAGQDVCAILESGQFECVAWASANLGFQVWSSASLSAASPWIRVPAFGQEIIAVGDFDHDSRDDLILYAPQTRSFRFLTAKAGLGCDPTWGCGPVFTTMANIDANSLNNFMAASHFDLSFKQMYVGAFLGSEQDDLLFLDHNTGEVYVFDGRYTTSGTFVFTFAAPPNEIAVSSSPAFDSTISVANVDGSSRDSIVTYTSGSGAIRFLQVPSSGTHLTDVPMLPTQLPGAASEGSRLFFAKTSNWGEPGSNVREDVYFYNAGVQQYGRVDARFSGGNTYWWAYNQAIRRFDLEFPPMSAQQLWLIMLCNDSDVPAQSWFGKPAYAWLYGKAGRNTPNMYNFFKDMSYGTANYATDIRGPSPLTTAQSTRYRTQTIVDCLQASGAPANWPDFFYRALAITNGVDDFGSYNGAPWATLDIRSSTEIYTPGHEMGHALGTGNSFPHGYGAIDCGATGDPGEYCDSTDPMGSNPFGYYWGGTPIQLNGTGFNVSAGYGAATRIIGGWVPDARQISLSTGATRTTQTITLAGLDRPESPGYLLAAVQPTSDPQNTYLVEYRSRTGRWDSALPSDGIVIRHFIFNNNWGQRVGYVEGGGFADSLMGVGATFTEAGMTVRVVSIDPVSGSAAVEITY